MINADHARGERARGMLGAGGGAREDVGGEAEWQAVRARDNLAETFKRRDDSNRPKGFLAHQTDIVV